MLMSFTFSDCKDHVECIEYPVSSCNNLWMKQNCRSKCALCGGELGRLSETLCFHFRSSNKYIFSFYSFIQVKPKPYHKPKLKNILWENLRSLLEV